MIFHTRDYPITELFDYVFAYSMVLASFWCFIIRFVQISTDHVIIINSNIFQQNSLWKIEKNYWFCNSNLCSIFPKSFYLFESKL